MQATELYSGIEDHPGLHLVPDVIARTLEKIKLQHRAEKYQFKEDSGGIAYLRRNIKKGDTVFDIGAHKAGYLFFFLQQLGSTGRVYAFEPQSVLHKYLQRLKTLFHWNNVTLECAAVSATTGTALLCVPQNKGQHSSPCATIINSRMPFQYQLKEEVKTISLDEYCRHLRIAPDFLKVDVEGSELAVFKGAEKTLRYYRPKILFESEARFVGAERVMETFSFLQHLGYSGSFIRNKTVLPIEAFSIPEHQGSNCNCYCNNFIFE